MGRGGGAAPFLSGSCHGNIRGLGSSFKKNLICRPRKVHHKWPAIMEALTFIYFSRYYAIIFNVV